MEWNKFCAFTFLIILKHSNLIYKRPPMSGSLDIHNTMGPTVIYDGKRIKIRHNLPLAPFITFLLRTDQRAFKRIRSTACNDVQQDFAVTLKKIKDKTKLSLKPFSTEPTHVCCTYFARRGLTLVNLSRDLSRCWSGSSFVCVL